jgi:tetratricopeptide (TPR) repeat protein
MIVRTLCGSFDKVTVWDTAGGDYLFVAGPASMAVSLEALRDRAMAPTVRADLHRLGINHVGQILGTFIASDSALRAWSASAIVHTDDNAVLEFAAPRQMLRNETYEISQALAALQQSAFDGIVLVDRASDWQIEVTQRVARAATARGYRDLAYRRRREGDSVGALEAFARGYREDPGNIGVSYGFHYMMAEIRESGAPVESVPRLRAVLAELDSYRGPMLAPITGGTLEEIVQFNTKLGAEAFEQGFWFMAGEYFGAAVGIQPDNPDLQQLLAVSYSRCGRLDEAIDLMNRVLERRPDDPEANFTRGQFAVFADDFDEALRRFEFVLRSGAISPGDLAANQSLAKIHGHPDFVALLERFRISPN